MYTKNSSAVLASLDYCGSVGDGHVEAIQNNFYKTFVHKYCTESKIVEKILHLGLTYLMSKGLVMFKWPLIGWSFWKVLSNTHTWVYRVYIKQAINTLLEASCKEPCNPKSPAVEKAPCPSRASTLSLGPGWWSLVTCPFLPYLWRCQDNVN